MSLLEVKGIVCSYGGKPVLNGLSLTADRGLLTGVIGPNGSGKSTLIKAVSGLLSLSSGEICLGGRRLCNYTPRALACCLAVLAQDIHIEFEFTVREIVAMGRHPFLGRVQREGLSDKEITERAMVETDTLHLADRSVTTISGGERQRVLLARALAQQAELLEIWGVMHLARRIADCVARNASDLESAVTRQAIEDLVQALTEAIATVDA